jgi:hypothetical protein
MAGQTLGDGGGFWAAVRAAWNGLCRPLASVSGGEGRPPQNAAGHAETKRQLKAALRESNFKPPSVATQRQRAAARMCELIEQRGARSVERVLMKVGNR